MSLPEYRDRKTCHRVGASAGPCRPGQAVSRGWRIGHLAHLFRALPQGVEQKPQPSYKQDNYAIPASPLTRVLVETDTIDIRGSSYKVLHLPGHSPGSIGLLDETSGVFFSGDAIYDGTLVDDLPGCDKSAYRTTMRRLQHLDVSVGQGAPMSCERLRMIANAYLDAQA